MGFTVGQRVIYPNHGIGTIERIEQKQIGAEAGSFYALRLAATNTTVFVPVQNADEIGLRLPITITECDRLYLALSDDFSKPATDWKIRFREFSEIIKSGNVFAVADVLKKLCFLSRLKPLSFREQRLFEKARYLVISELSTVCGEDECDIEPRVTDALERACAIHAGSAVKLVHSAAVTH